MQLRDFKPNPCPPLSFRRLSILAAALCLLPALTGCGPKRMKADFIGFEKAYAETSNREMLLNLARLQNRDPTYFFKLGSISSSYTMGATISGTGNYSIPTSNNGGQNATGGGTTGLSMSNTPSFTFIPVNDETNARILLNPIPAETFYILYQQGWRADQLFRLMVDRIELTHNYGKSCSVEVFHNTPPQADPSGAYTGNAADSLSSYATFLRVSAIVYELQKHGDLLVRGNNTFVPYDTSADYIEPTQPPTADNISKAASTSETWRTVDGKKRYGKQVFMPGFYLSPVKNKLDAKGVAMLDDKGKPVIAPDIDEIMKQFEEDSHFSELTKGLVLKNVLESISQGFSIESANPPSSQANTACDPKSPTPPHLVMRSLLGMMSAVAQEEAPFDALLKINPAIPPTRFPPPMAQTLTEVQRKAFQDAMAYKPNFQTAVPAVELIPALRLHRVPGIKVSPALVQIDYKGREFLVADFTGTTTVQENIYWNHDIFRLLSQLISQVTIDISKFPVPEILQLHTTQ